MISFKHRKEGERTMVTASNISVKIDNCRYPSWLSEPASQNPTLARSNVTCQSADPSSSLEKISKELDIPINGETSGKDDALDNDWFDLVHEAMNSGISKEQSREYLEFNKWKIHQGK
ncbi:anti-repressor SinI family protein [Halobacillus shinanisalinarum]|uniref:anti-repressor SinI family protein n=1 Tax=Halobacillus shinanisalinarum TaxID=2932258 RepID=UPI0029623A7A|nr:anti-repressor SinI family protein [Halobacillus shinanisalinarum]